MGEHDQPAKLPAHVRDAIARVGTALNAKWRVDRLLGVGGMGAVFAVTHRNNGSRAAAKLLHASYLVSHDVLDRFLREGKIANSIDHEARVVVFDDDITDLGEPFLVMELLEGHNLAELLHAKGGRLPADEALRIFDPVLALLAQCHAASIVHRDVKPANVFLTQPATGASWSGVKVLDFGVARMRDPGGLVEATRAGVALGTAAYIAPEQALGVERIDGRADLFSVGACLFTAMSGIRLHKAHTEAEEFVLAATQPAPSVAHHNPDLPAEVVAFVDKALAYDRLRRFQSAAEMRAELLRLVGGLRSGQLKVGSGGKRAGVVVRGNELLDDDERTEREKAIAIERMSGIFRALGHTMASVRQYGLAHPQAQKSLAQAYAEVGAALVADPAGVSWDVTATAFVVHGSVVWRPDRMPLDRIPHQLFADGIRRVQLKPGLDERELGDLLAILLRGASGVSDTEDDSVTALWDRRFEHIAYLAVDSFAEVEEGDDETRAEWDDVAQRALTFACIDKDWDDGSTEVHAGEIGLALSLSEAGEAAAAVALDPLTRATLGAQVALSPEQWQERYVEIFAQAYMEAGRGGDIRQLLDTLREWSSDQVALNAADRAFEVFRQICVPLAAHLDDDAYTAAERSITNAMFPVETLRIILTQMAAQRGEGAQDAIRPLVVAGLDRALERLDSGAELGLVCECLGATRSEPLREVLRRYAARWIAGQESTVSAMLGNAGRELGVALVALLVEIGTPHAIGVLDAAFKNPNIEVQLSALSHSTTAPAERVRDVAHRILENPDPAVRTEALALVGKLQIVAAGPILVRRIQSDAFHELPVDERREWLTALAALKNARAEAIAIELLSKRQILSAAGLDQTRVLAAEMLATASSDEALGALQDAAQKRWGNPESVRDAAMRSLLEARRLRDASVEGKP